MPIAPQQDIFGNLSYNIDVLLTARKIMAEKPATFKSHRLLMLEVAKEICGTWITKLSSEDLHQLETILDLSPDFERAARKVREEREEEHRRALVGV